MLDSMLLVLFEIGRNFLIERLILVWELNLRMRIAFERRFGYLESALCAICCGLRGSFMKLRSIAVMI